MSAVSALQAPVSISNAIKKASGATGVDFSYLLKTAARESSFNKGAKAKTSSAAGLFQFIESTWLKTVKDVGDKFGLDKYTPHIHKTQNGRYYVPNRRLKNEILQLRHNPEISAMMAGAFTQKNSDFVQSHVGREPSPGELYIAHFLGAKGAAKMISLAENRPNARADRHFPAAARANKPIFYSRGRPRTVAQVYKNLVRHHQKTDATAAVVAQKTPEATPAIAPSQGTAATATTPKSSAVASLAQHFKQAKANNSAVQQSAAQSTLTAAAKPLPRSPARQIIPSEQDLKALTHKVALALAPTPAASETNNLGSGVETQIIEGTSQAKSYGLTGQRAAPFQQASRVASLTGNRANLGGIARAEAPIGSIGSWTTIVQAPAPAANSAPPPVAQSTERSVETAKPEPSQRTRRRTRAPNLLEQSAQRASSARGRANDLVSRIRSDDFWGRMAMNAG